jgi:hypothetical protein
VSLRGIGVVVCATAEVGNDGAGEAEERLVLPTSLKMSVIKIVLPFGGENEASRLTERYAAGRTTSHRSRWPTRSGSSYRRTARCRSSTSQSTWKVCLRA